MRKFILESRLIFEFIFIIVVRQLTKLRKEELKQCEENEQELTRLKEKEAAQKNDQMLKEIFCLEKEYDDIERECAVLKVSAIGANPGP